MTPLEVIKELTERVESDLTFSCEEAAKEFIERVDDKEITRMYMGGNVEYNEWSGSDPSGNRCESDIVETAQDILENGL